MFCPLYAERSIVTVFQLNECTASVSDQTSVKLFVFVFVVETQTLLPSVGYELFELQYVQELKVNDVVDCPEGIDSFGLISHPSLLSMNSLHVAIPPG